MGDARATSAESAIILVRVKDAQSGSGHPLNSCHWSTEIKATVPYGRAGADPGKDPGSPKPGPTSESYVRYE